MDDMPMAALMYAGSQRFRTQASDRETWHSFSFGPHYDPANVAFGPLTSLNDEHLGSSAGYPDHGHADVEIVTWVVQGALRHTDDTGTTVLEAGSVLAQSAGSGIQHAEMADGQPTRFVQTWLRPDTPGGAPSLAQVLVPETDSGLIQVVGSDGLPVAVNGARLLAGTLAANETLSLPDAARQHVFVASGTLLLPGRSGVEAHDGDALRIIDGRGPLTAAVDTRLLVWSF